MDIRTAEKTLILPCNSHFTVDAENLQNLQVDRSERLVRQPGKLFSSRGNLRNAQKTSEKGRKEVAALKQPTVARSLPKRARPSIGLFIYPRRYEGEKDNHESN